MAGLLSGMFGDSPFYKGFDQRRNSLANFGLGLMQGKTPQEGLAKGVGGMIEGKQQDDAFATQQKAEAERLKGINSTVEFMRQKGYNDLVAGVEGGGLDMATAWGEAMKRSTPGYGAPDLTANMRDYQFAQSNPDYAEFIGGNSGKAPASVQEYEYARRQGYNGSFTEFQTAKKPTPPMNATTQKEIFETDEAQQAGQASLEGLRRALELNSVAYDGPFADQRSAASALFGDQGGIATQELKNVITSQALESLKAVFGGMPTEGERKILLEIQGSVDKPKPVREAIYKRAIAAAERRIAANQQKGTALRAGDYFSPSYTPSGTAAPGGQTSGGLQWSIEP